MALDPCNMAGELNNVTITLDEHALEWARVQAAERNLSLSRFVGDLIHQQMRLAREYEEAYHAWRGETPLKLKGTRPKREELYDRPVLRRR